MQCVDWTIEYLDGLIIVALLEANGLVAHLFGENFVRQDWILILMYGGFRVMVPDHQAQDARRIIDDFRSGALEPPAEDSESAVCPQCGKPAGVPDLNPRRWAFLIYFSAVLGFPSSMYYLWTLSDDLVAPSVVLVTALAICLPALIRQFVVGRYRCSSCATTWRALPDQHFHQQQNLAEAALQALQK